MRKLRIPNSNLKVSKLIFGTASVFNVGGRGQRRALLDAAVDAGFSHFDTAPYYGFGMAERDLAPVLRRHPNVTVTTKVGIYSPGGEGQSRGQIFARKSLGKIVTALSRPEIDFTVARAQKALDESLKRLGRDHIDIYMLHEPEIGIVEADEWQIWLENAVKSGKIGNFGHATTADRLAPFLKQNKVIGDIHQLCDSLDGQEADLLSQYDLPFQITYSYVSAALRSGRQDSYEEILELAMQRNREGAIIVSTTKKHRVSQLAEFAGNK